MTKITREITTTKTRHTGGFTVRKAIGGGSRYREEIGDVREDWNGRLGPVNGLVVFSRITKAVVPFTTRAAAIAWVVAQSEVR